MAKKKFVCEKPPGWTFLTLRPGWRNCIDFHFFPLSIRLNIFGYKILSCNSDNLISLPYSSRGYRRNILWDNTSDITLVLARRTIAGGRQQVAVEKLKLAWIIVKERFSGVPGNFHFGHAVFRKQSILFGSPSSLEFDQLLTNIWPYLSESNAKNNRQGGGRLFWTPD